MMPGTGTPSSQFRNPLLPIPSHRLYQLSHHASVVTMTVSFLFSVKLNSKLPNKSVVQTISFGLRPNH